MEFFCLPEEAPQWHEHWVNYCREFLTAYGIKHDSIRIHNHEGDELAHYAASSVDIEFKFGHGWGELWGIANRTDYDLKCHAEASGKSMLMTDPMTNRKLHPYVIEPAVGLDRLVLAFLTDALRQEAPLEGEKEGRWVLGIHPALAPTTYAVLPLVKKEPILGIAQELHSRLTSHVRTDFDMAGSVGRRYRRQDEVGTPWCVTIDYQSIEDDTVTVRNRDTMVQERVHIEDIVSQAEAGARWVERTQLPPAAISK